MISVLFHKVAKGEPGPLIVLYIYSSINSPPPNYFQHFTLSLLL